MRMRRSQTLSSSIEDSQRFHESSFERNVLDSTVSQWDLLTEDPSNFI